MNAFEERARSSKAFVLVDVIDEQCRAAGLDPYSDALEIGAMLAEWPEAVWTMLAVGCGQYPPSETTRALIVARILSRAARRAEVAS